MNVHGIAAATREASRRRAIGVRMLREGAGVSEVMRATGAPRGTVGGWQRLPRGDEAEAAPPPAPALVASFAESGFGEDEPIGGRP